MPAPFSSLDHADLESELLDVKASIEARFAELQELFVEVECSDMRLKPLPGAPIHTFGIPHELATIHSLRALELAAGAAAAIETDNHVAAFPLLRSLFETWVVLAYAQERFTALAVEQSRWQRYDEIAMRLLVGRTQPGGRDIIRIGNMIDHVKATFGAELDEEERADWVTFIEDWYSMLSDGTHPTNWSLAYYGDPRRDELGMSWSRKPNQSGRGQLLGDLDLSLGLIARQLRDLLDSSERIRSSFEAGPYREQRHRERAVDFLRRIVESPQPEGMSGEAYSIARFRAAALIDYFEDQGTEGSEDDEP